MQPTYNNTIAATPQGSSYPWSASTGLLDVNFANTIGAANAIQIIKDGYQFAWKPDTVEVLDTSGNLTSVSTVNTNSTAQVWQNRLTYVGTTPLTSDEFEVRGNQLKHTVRMVAPPQLPSGYTATPQYLAIGGDIGTTAQDWADIDLWADGVTHTSNFNTSDDLRFCLKSNGSEVYRIPHITVTDANGVSVSGQYKLVFQPNNVVTLYMLVGWSWLQSAAYPIEIDPTVVVNTPYGTSGNGGRKIVRLSNNWIVVGVDATANLYWFVSKDNGTTWSQLCYTGLSNYTQGNFAVASSGTIVTTLTGAGPDISVFQFDASTVTNVGQSVLANISTTENSNSFLGVSIAIDGTGAIHAAWSSIVSTYPNSHNIRYSKSTNGGSTWTTPTQATTQNTSPNSYQYPCIVVTSLNAPVVLCNYSTGVSTNNIYSITGLPSPSINIVYSAGTYGQNSSCAAIDSNGVIHVVWYGGDATVSSYNNIRYTKSTDGGSTWSAMTNLTNLTTSGAAYPSIAVDLSNNDLYVLYHALDTTISATYSQVRELKYTSGAWQSPVTLTNDTTNNATMAQALWSEFNMNSSDAMRYIYQDAQAGSVEYGSIALNQPPNAPTLTAHANFDSTIAQTLAWTFSDPDSGNTQSAYQLQLYDTSNLSTPVIDTGKVGSTVSSYTLVANALTNGHSYQWRVQTWDQGGLQGPYSTYSTFACSATPTATVTSPSPNASIPANSYTFSGSYSQPSGVVEQSFEFKLYDSTGTNVLQDSGTVVGTSNLYTFGGLANNTTYQIQFITTSQQSIVASSAKVTFSTSFTPPATPTVSAVNNYSSASVTVTFTNGGGSPPASSNNLYRRKTGDATWTLVAQGATSPYTDYTCPAGQYDYGVTAISASNAVSGYGTATVASSFNGERLIDTSNSANNVMFLYNQVKATSDVKQTFTPVQTFAKYPRIRKSVSRYHTGTLNAIYVAHDGDILAQIDMVDAMANSDNTYLLKSVNGRIYRVVLSDMKVYTQYANNIGNVTVTWTEVGDV